MRPTGDFDDLVVGAQVDRVVTGVGVTVENHGTLELGTSLVTGRAQMESYEQTATGVFEIDIANITPGNFDVLEVQGNAILGGTLDVELNNAFTPVLGNTFTILETIFGNVSGEFDIEDVPVFDGLTLDVVYNSQSVVVQVVEAAEFASDLDNDVDGQDFLIIQRDNPSLIPVWRREYGFGSPPLASAQIVPEHSSNTILICGFVLSSIFTRRR